nr:uncharacterized protein LOC115259599 [Aedes albopictus]
MAQLLRLKRQKFNVQSSSSSVPVDHWKLPKDLFLADPEFNRSSDVDLILGSQHFFDCFPTAARIQLSNSLPILVESEFGWIVAGGAHLVPPSMDSVCCKTVTVSVDPLEKCMEKFWSVEELPMRSAFSVEEKACEDYYVSTVSRTQEGRYVVRYPKRENFSTMIGESKSTALRRFSMLEGRFSKNPGLQESYERGADSVPEAIQLRVELTELLAKGGFPIRKWTSNKLEVLQGLDADSIGTQSSLRFDPDETVKTLGICWEPERDQFRFNYHVSQTILRATKRSILSAISQLFDPLGLVAPIVVLGKMLMHELWLIACSWDDEVPDIVKQKWETFYHQLPKLSEFRIQRYAFQANSVAQLHTFADASEVAYGASVVAAQLHGRVNEALDMNIASSFFWSDSTVTLQWLKSPPNTWKTFVANRVSEIQTTTHGARWNHVAGSQNPANLLSRGMSVEDFLQSTLWKIGPDWLSRSEEDWPIPNQFDSSETDSERRPMISAVARAEPKYNPLFSRYSQFSRLTQHVLSLLSVLYLACRSPLINYHKPEPS